MSSGLWIVLGAAVGGILGAAGALLGGAIERASRSRGELIAAGAAWLAATDEVAQYAQLHAAFDEQPTTRAGQLLDKLADILENTIGKGRVELLRVLVQPPLMRDLQESLGRAREATIRLVLVAPPSLLEEISDPMQTAGRWLTSPQDAALRAAWEDDARGVVVRALRRHTAPRWRRPRHRR